MKNCAPLFRLLQVAHKLEAGAKRYVDLLSDDSFARKFPNGGNPMSGYNGCPCLWGARGPLVDNSSYAYYFTDTKLMEKSEEVMRKCITKWAGGEEVSAVTVPASDNGMKH